MTDTILTSQEAGVWTITLNRPDKLNSLDAATAASLQAALDGAEADAGCRALLLTGSGRGFCAGADLQAMLGRDLGAVLDESFNPVVQRIRASRLPVVCAVNGVAAGAGANIALACDIVLAARSARFIQAFIKIGLIPDVGGTWLLPRLAGQARARGMTMLGEPVTAEQALAWGLIWQVVEDDQLAATATALARRLATQPTTALGQIKRLMDAAETNTLDAQLALERDAQMRFGGGPDYQEGVAAFLEKRQPVFRGDG